MNNAMEVPRRDAAEKEDEIDGGDGRQDSPRGGQAGQSEKREKEGDQEERALLREGGESAKDPAQKEIGRPLRAHRHGPGPQGQKTIEEEREKDCGKKKKEQKETKLLKGEQHGAEHYKQYGRGGGSATPEPPGAIQRDICGEEDIVRTPGRPGSCMDGGVSAIFAGLHRSQMMQRLSGVMGRECHVVLPRGPAGSSQTKRGYGRGVPTLEEPGQHGGRCALYNFSAAEKTLPASLSETQEAAREA